MDAHECADPDEPLSPRLRGSNPHVIDCMFPGNDSRITEVIARWMRLNVSLQTKAARNR